MNSQMEQFFKGMLLFVMVMILGSFINNYLETNYSKFNTEETATFATPTPTKKPSSITHD